MHSKQLNTKLPKLGPLCFLNIKATMTKAQKTWCISACIQKLDNKSVESSIQHKALNYLWVTPNTQSEPYPQCTDKTTNNAWILFGIQNTHTHVSLGTKQLIPAISSCRSALHYHRRATLQRSHPSWVPPLWRTLTTVHFGTSLEVRHVHITLWPTLIGYVLLASSVLMPPKEI